MPSYFPEGNQPDPQDTEHRLLSKIAASMDSTVGGSSATAATRAVIGKTVASAGTPEVLAASSVTFRTVIFWGYKGNRTTNAGTVWIQKVSTNDSIGSPLPSGQGLSYTAPAGKTLNGGDFYIDVINDGDGVIADYIL